MSSQHRHGPSPGCIRVGTIQGCKGLEADVVVLVGFDERCAKYPATLYVGASRARCVVCFGSGGGQNGLAKLKYSRHPEIIHTNISYATPDETKNHHPA